MTATPRPWRVKGMVAGSYMIVGNGDRTVITTLGFNIVPGAPDDRPQGENAAFIVRAVNAHDDLVTALRDLLKWEKVMGGFESPAWDRARAALAKVTP